MKYPGVKHKIPELFKLIIANDDRRAELKSVDVISFNEFKELKKERQQFRRGAEHFIIKQKGGKV
jgi:hypothetical protein